MCGISGFVWAPENDNLARSAREVLIRMTDKLIHRGPDAAGYWTSEQHRIGMGHRRLSILDLSPLGEQPMTSGSERFTAVFNGELYNYLNVRRELDEAGVPPSKGHSDTEVLLAAVEEWGLEGALQRFAGMFALAIFDRKTSRLYLARDRIGEKPLYYGLVGSTFVFASELKPFTQIEGWDPVVSRQALQNYLWLGYVPSPLCIFKNIRKLEPGTIACVSTTEHPRKLDTVTLTKFWSLRAQISKNPPGSFTGNHSEAKHHLNETLTQVVRQHMLSDVPLGAFLSGGIDSSLIVALMQAESRNPVRTFSIGFDREGFNEAPYAAAVAKHLGTDHTELMVTGQDALNVLPKLTEIYDEPFSDSSQIPTYLVAKLARASVTVALSGDGGDEVFGGYTRYIYANKAWENLSKLPYRLRRIVALSALKILPLLEQSGMGAGKFFAQSHKSWMNATRLRKLLKLAGCRDFREVYTCLVSSWADPGRLLAFPSQAIKLFEEVDNLSREESMMMADSLHYLPDDILVKVDRACMAVSLESRAPYLDHRVVEFAWSLPLHLRVQNGEGKMLLKEVLFDRVPKALLDRPKMGFGVPLSEWLRGPLRIWGQDLLSSASVNRIGLNRNKQLFVDWNRHLQGIDGQETPLWTLLSLISWVDQWNARIEDADFERPIIQAATWQTTALTNELSISH
jgi:asparagine synthase (glutamine-hydrolysing)